jgi:pyruvate,water dikinase
VAVAAPGAGRRGAAVVTVVNGMAASGGVAEGPARVLRSAADIAQIRDGEVLVTTVTSPAWLPAFERIVAVVTDIGGIMSHAAIVSREYGLPAVTGTAVATAVISTGCVVLVDGDRGAVTVLRVHGDSATQEAR